MVAGALEQQNTSGAPEPDPNFSVISVYSVAKFNAVRLGTGKLGA